MTEIAAKLRSAHLGNERSIWVRAPRDPATAKHLTVFLDAEFYRERVGAPAVLDELGDAIADSWFVFVSVESMAARTRECPCHPPFARFVAEELLPCLTLQDARIGQVPQRTLVGLSYTGLAAAFVVKEYPGLFQRVISQSGSFWWENCRLVELFGTRTRLPTEFYLDVGTLEVQENVQHGDVLQIVSQINGVRRFRDVLQRNGHIVKYLEFAGGHDFAAWKLTLPGALRWALPRST